MSRYAFVVASNGRYLPGIIGILNSLAKNGNKHDVILLGYKLPEKLDEDIEKLPFKVNHIDLSEEWIRKYGEAEVLMRYRYMIPYQLAAECNCYDAFCILDADMLVLQDMTRYFRMVDGTGLILGCTLEQKRRYAEENHEVPPGSGNYLIPKDFWNGRDLCCAPLFLGPMWYEALKKTWEIFAVEDPEKRFRAPDMDALNICLIEAGAYDHIIPGSQHVWTGLHEVFMKAHTRIIDQHGVPFTEDGEEINIIHGQYWNKKWRGWQIDNQHGMIKREFDNSKSYHSRSDGSFEYLLRLWEGYLKGPVINGEEYLQSCTSHEPAKNIMDIL